MPAAYSFECHLRFTDAVKLFDALDDWVKKPDLDGRWLVRDNDRVGDYLSYYAFDENDRSIVKTIRLFFDTRPLQATFEVFRDEKAPRGSGDIKRVAREHEAYVLNVLLPSIGVWNVQPSDFEK